MPTIIELQDEPDITRAFPLMSQLRDRIHAETFVAEVRRQQADGYHLIAAIEADRIVGLAGIRRSHTLSRGPHLFVDDLVTDDARRGRGVGTALMAWLEGLARAEGLPRIYLDSRATAQGFYEKLGFTFLTAVPSWKDVAGTA
ncbi:MAG TPA: GNAT family N-acetyltransferase [Vicinamibacterales bacterium]|nr:GNAT family N-acetyltransferase [Vicinamibacterales bacterium]